MKVTDKQYSLDRGLIKFLDRIADRINRTAPKLDYPLLIDGYEGYGKSNMAAGIGYYIAWKTNRPFSLNNIFFDPEDMLKFAITQSNQIIIWDEAALAALAMQHSDALQIAIVKMLMVARKKRHLFIICIPRFYRLKEPIIERCMGLVHIYARNETEIGRFCFYKKKSFDKLYEDYKRTRRKPDYRYYINARGTFGEALPLVVNEEEYELKKDKGIMTVLESGKKKKDSKKDEEITSLKIKIAGLKPPLTTKQDIALQLGIPIRTIRDWYLLKEDINVQKSP